MIRQQDYDATLYAKGTDVPLGPGTVMTDSAAKILMLLLNRTTYKGRSSGR